MCCTIVYFDAASKDLPKETVDDSKSPHITTLLNNSAPVAPEEDSGENQEGTTQPDTTLCNLL